MSCRVVAEEAPLGVASLAEPAPPAMPSLNLNARGDEPFGLSSEAKPGPLLDQKWRDAERAIRADLAAIEQCRATDTCNEVEKSFIALADAARAQTGRARLGVTNRTVNLSIVATTDLAQYGVDDVWSSPLETLTTRKGDCEDYAILKVAVLRAAGVAADDLRLAVVRDPASNEGHAVAAVRLDGRWLVLDNRRFTLVDAASSSYRPFFALHLQGEPADGVVAQGAGADIPYLL
jgi:predicted transglutaminase-like cysteine proteinase